MQVLRNGQQRVWDEALPEEVRELGPELAKVDRWLRDEELFEPFRKRFACKVGRPTVPVSTFVRLMYLKDRYGLGYESLAVEVRDSIQWRRFCEIPLDGKVPHPTTLSKLAKRYGDDTDAPMSIVTPLRSWRRRPASLRTPAKAARSPE